MFMIWIAALLLVLISQKIMLSHLRQLFYSVSQDQAPGNSLSLFSMLRRQVWQNTFGPAAESKNLEQMLAHKQTWREYVLSWALRPLQGLLMTGLLFFLFQINGLFLIIFWFVLSVIYFVFKVHNIRFLSGIRFIFWSALWLIFFDLLLKQNILFRSTLQDSIFWFTDGRLENLLVIFAVAFFISFLIRGFYWSWAVGVYLVYTQTSPISVALVLVLAEMLVQRSDSVFLKKEFKKSWSILNMIFLLSGFVLGFLMIGFYRDFLMEISSGEFVMLSKDFIIGVALLIGEWLILGMVVGHFVSLKKEIFITSISPDLLKNPNQSLGGVDKSAKTFVESLISFVIQ